jgi:hypothetical protein
MTYPAPPHETATAHEETATGHELRGLRRRARLLALTLTVAVVALLGASAAPAASAQSITNEFGTLKTSKVTGKADNGATFSGHYRVKKFVTGDNGRSKAVGRLTGVVTKKSGATERVTKYGVRMPVRPGLSSVTGLPPVPGTVATSQVGCEILDLVLGPLDLNLLGLEIHLDVVHLNITAVPGAGNLLGNLLCAVAGLLDGPALGNLGSILTNLLNAILGILRA